MKVHAVEKEPLPPLEHSMARDEGGRRPQKDKAGMISAVQIMLSPTYCSKVLILQGDNGKLSLECSHQESKSLRLSCSSLYSWCLLPTWHIVGAQQIATE